MNDRAEALRSEYDVLVNGTRYAGANDLETVKRYAIGYIEDGEPLVIIRKKEPGKKWRNLVTYRQGRALAEEE